MSNPVEMNLTGFIDQDTEGNFPTKKYCVTIQLRTPDGKDTTLTSGFIYTDLDEAQKVLEQNLADILTEFRAVGVDVVSKTVCEKDKTETQLLC
jgi:hypothetical protein